MKVIRYLALRALRYLALMDASPADFVAGLPDDTDADFYARVEGDFQAMTYLCTKHFFNTPEELVALAREPLTHKEVSMVTARIRRIDNMLFTQSEKERQLISAGENATRTLARITRRIKLLTTEQAELLSLITSEQACQSGYNIDDMDDQAFFNASRPALPPIEKRLS